MGNWEKGFIIFFILSGILIISNNLEESKKETIKRDAAYYAELLGREEMDLDDWSKRKMSGNGVSCGYLNMNPAQGEIKATCSERITGKSCILTLTKSNDWNGCNLIRER